MVSQFTESHGSDYFFLQGKYLVINLELSNNKNFTLATIHCPNGKPLTLSNH